MIPRRVVLPAVVLVLALAGCAGRGVAPGEDPAPVDSPTPPATAEPQGDPLPTLPLACSDFFSDADATALLYRDVSLKVDQDDTRNNTEAAQRQEGLLECIWGGDTSTDSSWDQTIVLTILPDAAAAFDEGVWQVDDGAIPYPDGSTTSEYLCPQVFDNFAWCNANVLVDGYWAQVRATTENQSDPISRDEIEASIRSIVDRLTTVISSAGPARPQWTTSAHTLTGAICAGQPFFVDVPPYPLSAAQAAGERSNAVGCSYSENVSINVVPGGAWAVPAAQAAAGKDLRAYGLISTYASTPVPGADLALYGCGAGCQAMLSIGGSSVEIYDRALHYDDGVTFLAELPAIVADVIAAG